MITTQYKIHEVANLFPMMSEDEFSALVADIQANGQLEPIWIHQEEIIDGRNRYKACEQLGFEPKVREWTGAGSLVSFVSSMNLKRRHLTPSQKSTIAAEMLPMMERESKERQKQAGENYGRGQGKITEKFPQAISHNYGGEAREQAAKLLGINPHYVSDAKRIQQEAPAVFDLMKRGEVTMSKAKQLTAIPEETRSKVLENFPKQEPGKTKVCVLCTQLLPIEKFDAATGSTKCNSCRGKIRRIEQSVQKDAASFKDNPAKEITFLRKKVKELELQIKELNITLADERRRHMIIKMDLEGQLFVIHANLTERGITL